VESNLPKAENAPKRLQFGPLGQVLGYLLANASISTDRVFDERVLKPLQLRKVEYTIVNLIDQNPGVKANKVAKVLGFSAANTSVWLEKLCDKGFLSREPDPIDKRAHGLFVTAQGLRLCHIATEQILQGEQETLKHLSLAEQAMLRELLVKYAAGRGRQPTTAY
jgi:DNA-binding MarR family transcriptional regulator